MDSARPFKSEPILAPGVPAIQKISKGEVAGNQAVQLKQHFRVPLHSPNCDSQLDPS